MGNCLCGNGIYRYLSLGLLILLGFDFRGTIGLTLDFANLLLVILLLGSRCSGPWSHLSFVVFSFSIPVPFLLLLFMGIWYSLWLLSSWWRKSLFVSFLAAAVWLTLSQHQRQQASAFTVRIYFASLQLTQPKYLSTLMLASASLPFFLAYT